MERSLGRLSSTHTLYFFFVRNFYLDVTYIGLLLVFQFGSGINGVPCIFNMFLVDFFDRIIIVGVKRNNHVVIHLLRL